MIAPIRDCKPLAVATAAEAFVCLVPVKLLLWPMLVT